MPQNIMLTGRELLVNMKVEENKFIPSIFNYCDRWCEHCSFTDRCRLFSMEEKRNEENEGKEFNFVEELQKTFAETRKLIEEYSEKFNIDLSTIKEEVEKETPGTPLSFLSTKYFEDAAVYLNELMNEIKENSVVSAIIPRNPGMLKLRQIVECYEVLQWYHTMIPVKITRAISSAAENDPEDEEFEFSMDDANGSAFVALKSVLKSMVALGVILDWTESLKNETLNLIIDAGRIKSLIEKDFPGALTFIWPPVADEVDR